MRSVIGRLREWGFESRFPTPSGHALRRWFPLSRHAVQRATIIVASSKQRCGSYGRAHPGETCRRCLGSGAVCIGAFGAGRWALAGRWHQLHEVLQVRPSDDLLMDSTIVKAHPHAAGALKKGAGNHQKVSAALAVAFPQRFMRSFRPRARWCASSSREARRLT